MENIVSSRRLRKSMLNNMVVDNIPDLDNLRDKNIKKEKSNSRIKNKILIKVFISVLIVFSILIGKLMFPKFFLNNKYSKIIINEYKKDYSKDNILEKIEGISKYIYTNIKYIVPDKVYTYITYNYMNKIKPKVLEFNLVDSINRVLKEQVLANKEDINIQSVENNEEVNDENNENIENNEENLNGMGGAEPIEKNDSIEVSSAISIMDSDISDFLSKNINMIKPVSGTITSIYGARDEIFDGVNSYHTGLDVANKKDTKIISATDGEVINSVLNNKYYGNYIEIETEGVIFKYAHMNELKVKKGDKIKQGELIGLMGSTGMSTGPHLHFEIKINSRTIDPQQVVEFY